MITRWCVFLLFLIKSADNARILAIFPAPGYSQFLLGHSLLSALVKNGHHVTLVSPYKPDTRFLRYQHISTQGFLEEFKDFDYFKVENVSFFTSFTGSLKLGLRLSEFVLSEPKVQELLHKNAKFDLVIVEQFLCESLLGFAKFFSAPLVIFSSIGPSEWSNHLMGNPGPPSILPIMKLPFTTQMGFTQRLKNFVCYLVNNIYKNFVIYPKHDALLKKYFSKDMDLDQVIYNASLLLLNSHFSVTDPFPLLPGMVEVGGFHIKPAQQLSEKLQEFLDGARDGAIIFSLGTNLKGSNFNRNKLKSIIEAFSQIKQRVLWSFNGDLTSYKLSENVMVSEWLPQTDILGHPNIVLFISHGGLLGLTEAVYFGVPVIGIPVFGDQKMNIAKAERYGYALKIPFQDFDGDSLLKAIHQVVEDKKYTEKAKERQRFYHDQPLKPLDLALFWIERVIRNKGGRDLRFAGVDLYWFQLYMLDIVFVIIAFLVLIGFLLKLALPTMRLSKKLKIE